MAGSLAGFLARRFAAGRGRGQWLGETEAPLLDRDLSIRYGFTPHVDLLLSGPMGERVAVELEVSRADPVANQAKFLATVLEGALSPDVMLVSMVSPHVAPGRRNLTGLFARSMRRLGVPAFQVSLLPHFSPAAVRELNHLSEPDLAARRLPVGQELGRVLNVAAPRGEREHRIHFVGDVSDVMANLWTWNHEVSGEERDLWGRRAIQFFVYDPVSSQLAPSKFCAFVPVKRPSGPLPPSTMTLEVYASLGEQDPRFDGHRARKHLVRGLAFSEVDPQGALGAAFEAWLAEKGDSIRLRRPVRILVPPSWYRRG